jgi:hypothetical protein
MTDYTRQQSGTQPNSPHGQRENNGCGRPSDPADQPRDPGGNCDKVDPTKPPTLDEPEKCPDPPCCCPHTVPPGPNCIDELIKAQAKEITEAERAKTFKEDLEQLQERATAAQKEYTIEKYKKLVKDWKDLDSQIVDLIRRLVCVVPCWWCLIECHVCPLFYAIRYREQKLSGGGALYADVHSLYDLRYWHQRDLDNKRIKFERIKKVLSVWESPATKIEEVIATNKELVKNAGNVINQDAPKFIVDVFLRLITSHLAIAPPASSGEITGIGKEYTTFCECDTGNPDDCCGPDVGMMSLREQLVGPLPYLVRPDQYFPIICCLTKERYLPAKDALATAESDFQRVDGDVKRYEDEIVSKMSSLEADAKAAIPVPVDCDEYTGSNQANHQQPPAQAAR